MSDSLLWGSSRPRIRVGTSAQTNGTNYVFNQPPAEIDIYFPKQIILNESVLNIYLNEHIIKRRGIFTFDYEVLDRPSCERLIDILNSSSDKYMRPCFNFWKEYKVRCVNEWELDRIGKSNQPYEGILKFETIAGEDAIPSESSGSFSFNGSTKVANTLASTLSGDCTVEMWIKTPSSFSSQEELFSMTSAGVVWTVSIKTDGTIEFVTDDGSSDIYNNPNLELKVDTWHFLTIGRVNTHTKVVCIDGVCDGTIDNKAANAITATTLGAAANAFSGYCQIYRIYNDDLVTGSFPDAHLIEAIDSSYEGNIKLWWDFSQGAGTDLSAEGNDGDVMGTTTYAEESFPDKRNEILT